VGSGRVELRGHCLNLPYTEYGQPHILHLNDMIIKKEKKNVKLIPKDPGIQQIIMTFSEDSEAKIWEKYLVQTAISIPDDKDELIEQIADLRGCMLVQEKVISDLRQMADEVQDRLIASGQRNSISENAFIAGGTQDGQAETLEDVFEAERAAEAAAAEKEGNLRNSQQSTDVQSGSDDKGLILSSPESEVDSAFGKEQPGYLVTQGIKGYTPRLQPIEGQPVRTSTWQKILEKRAMTEAAQGMKVTPVTVAEIKASTTRPRTLQSLVSVSDKTKEQPQRAIPSYGIGNSKTSTTTGSQYSGSLKTDTSDGRSSPLKQRLFDRIDAMSDVVQSNDTALKQQRRVRRVFRWSASPKLPHPCQAQ